MCKLYRYILGAFLFFYSSINAQIFIPRNVDPETVDSIRNANKNPNWQNNKYIYNSTILSPFSFKDLATSPLLYSGLAIGTNGGSVLENEKIDQNILFNLSLGLASNSFNQTNTMATFTKFETYYHLLFNLPQLSNTKWNTKLGFAASITFTGRLNAAFGNNSLGLDNMNNIFLSAKTERDISRKQAVIKDFKLFKLKYLPTNHKIGFQTNIGLLNTNYRPGFAYVYSGEINGNNTSPISYFFTDYKFSINGFRMVNKLYFTKYLKNGNAFRYFYDWEYINAPGRYESYQLIMHNIGFALMFNK
jgi:hypothetical protein